MQGKTIPRAADAVTLLGLPKMIRVPIEEREEEFPQVGSRARRFKRFERDLHAWLATPEGRFAAWWARRQVETAVTLPSTPRTDP
jgi:hypothetical protein